MTDSRNLLFRVGYMWKRKHTHDDDPDLQEQITIIRQTVEEQSDVVSGSATGAHLHLLRSASQEIAVGGEAIEWDSVFSVHPAFEFNETPPVTAVTIPKAGYYNVRVEFGWASWVGGGSVQLIRTRDGSPTVVWPSPVAINWTATNSRGFVDTAEAIAFRVGDLIEVVVDHGDSSAQDISSGLLVVYLDDRYTVEPIVVPDVPPEQLFIFTEDGTFDWSDAGSPATVDVWIIAGGGGGGSSEGEASWRGGGGGAGGVLILEDYPVSGDCAVVVGAGGIAEDNSFSGGDGGDSSFDGETATGGGGGGGKNGLSGRDGGSGGGSASSNPSFPGGSGIPGEGNDGGIGNTASSSRAGGGGGGYGAPGADGTIDGDGGDGGTGIDLSAIVGTEWGEAGWFAGGGGGGAAGGAQNSGAGGTGGGGRGGQPAVAGLTNSGGGGGGARIAGNARDGGSGIVIVRVSA